MASPSSSLSVLLVGGPTAVLEYAGLRLLTDPTFDPPGEQAGGLTKLTGPAVSADDVGAIDAVLLSHDQHSDNLDRRRARVPRARGAHADHHHGRRAPGRQRRRPRAVGVDRARAPGRRRGHGHRRPGAARPRRQRARDRARGRLRAHRRRRPDALRQRRQRLPSTSCAPSPSASGRSSSRCCSPAASACRSASTAPTSRSAPTPRRRPRRSSAPAPSSPCTSRAGGTSPRARGAARGVRVGGHRRPPRGARAGRERQRLSPPSDPHSSMWEAMTMVRSSGRPK